MASTARDKCTVISYNLHGLINQGSVLLSDLFATTNATVVFVQEHWLTPFNMHKIIKSSNNYTGFGISAMEMAVSHSVLRGRPFGGVATLVHNIFLSQVTCIKNAERFSIITLGLTMYVNVYLPCHSLGSDDMIHSLLTEIGDIISVHPGYTLVFGGDLNNNLTDNSISRNYVKH